MQVIQRGFVEGHTLEKMIRSIRGTKEFDFKDGILDTSRQSARMLARTLCNGASNAGRMEIYEQNKDVLDGVKFLGTFDSKTCPVCASLDGKIWATDEMNQAVRPRTNLRKSLRDCSLSCKKGFECRRSDLCGGNANGTSPTTLSPIAAKQKMNAFM